MGRFTESPYFLLKDYISEVISPAERIDDSIQIENYWDDVMFVDAFLLDDGTFRYTESTSEHDTSAAIGETFNVTDDVVFTSTEGVKWNAFEDISTTSSYESVDDEGMDARLIGMGKTIIANGGKWLELFVDITGEDVPTHLKGYIPFRFEPTGTEPFEKKFFEINLGNVVSPVSAEVPIETYNSEIDEYPNGYDSNDINLVRYNYEIKDLTSESASYLDSGMDVYFRKDSAFHDWLRKNANTFYKTNRDNTVDPDEYTNVDLDIRSYVNTDKMFTYFGKLYKVDNPENDNLYNVVFDGMKDYVRRALPENNRTPNYMEFLDTFFDQQYSEGYNLLKNVWTLRDARECDARFLGYLPSYYAMPNFDKVDTYVNDQYREFVFNLVELLKHKGSYAALRIIYDIFCKNSENIFTIYEKWHQDSIEGIVPRSETLVMPYVGNYKVYPNVSANNDSNYENDVSYTIEEPTGHPYDTMDLDFPDTIFRAANGVYVGAGRGWYRQYDTVNYPVDYVESSGMRLSHAYRVDLDLSVLPVTSTKIMPRSIAQNLYDNWDIMRPVNRQAEYNFLLGMFVDQTGNEYSLYEGSGMEDQCLVSSKVAEYEDTVDSFVHIQSEPFWAWEITHSLETEQVMVDTYDTNRNVIYPGNVIIVDENTVRVEFYDSYQMAGVAVVSRAEDVLDLVYTEYANGDDIIQARHYTNRKEFLVSAYNVVTKEMEITNGVQNNNDIQLLCDSRQPAYDTGTTASLSDNVIYGKKGVAVGDELSDSTTITSSFWEYNQAVLVTDPLDPDYDYWVWSMYNVFNSNGISIKCYDNTGHEVVPVDIILDRPSDDPNYQDMVRIRWAKKNQILADGVATGSMFGGYMAVENTGILAQYDGLLPLDEYGEALPLEFRLSVETDDHVYVSFREDDPRAAKYFPEPTDEQNEKIIEEGGVPKVYHYYSYISGMTHTHWEDDIWHYYTFTAKQEYINVSDGPNVFMRKYDVKGIELINNGIPNYHGQKIVFAKLSGVYKPDGINFVGHFRIYKDPAGFLGAYGLLDTEEIPLLDTDGNLMAG